MCVVSHGLGDTYTPPVSAPHSCSPIACGYFRPPRPHRPPQTPHSRDLGHSRAGRCAGGVRGGRGTWLSRLVGCSHPSWSGEVSHPGSRVSPIPAPTHHNLGHPHIHFPQWKVVKVITSLTTPVCKPMQNCDPSHTPFLLAEIHPARSSPGGHHTPHYPRPYG